MAKGNIEVPKEALEDAKLTMSAEGRDKFEKAVLDQKLAKTGIIGRTKQLLKSPLGVGAVVAGVSAVVPVSAPVVGALGLMANNPLTTAAVAGGATVVDHIASVPKRLERRRIQNRMKKSGPKEKPKSQAA